MLLAGLIPFLGYHHVLMMFLMMGIVASSIILAGCTSSNSLRNVYLLSISYLNTTTSSTTSESSQVNPNISTAFDSLTGTSNGTSLEVRAGFLGLCLGQDVGGWLCSSSATALAELLEAESGGANRNISGGGDPLNLIWIASNFRNDIVFDGLIFTAIPLAFITLLLLATFPGWHEEEDETGSEREVKPFPSRPVSMIALGIIGLASILMFVSIFWQHVASSAAATMVHSLRMELSRLMLDRQL